MRTYERTHPWITFSVDLSRASPSLWVMLGECQSKCEHVGGVPLRPATASQLFEMYLAKGAQATTAIEGNTLSEEEVLSQVKGTPKLPPSREYLAQEVQNILDGCHEIRGAAEAVGGWTVASQGIKELNRIVLKGVRLEDGVVPVGIPTRSFGVGRYRGAPREDCDYLLDRLCDWLASDTFKPRPGTVVLCAILKAIVAHLYLAWIHPFGDGNGRTARLIEFQILVSSGVPAPCAHLLSNHYNQTRSEYYRQLDRASKSGGEVLPFVTYAVQGFLDGLRDQLQTIRDQHWDVAWRSFVQEAFIEKAGPAAERRRHLVLDLSWKDSPVPRGELRHVSPRIAEAYATKQEKTLTRDLNALVEMQLVEKTRDGYRARKELILAFLPAKVRADKTL